MSVVKILSIGRMLMEDKKPVVNVETKSGRTKNGNDTSFLGTV